MLTYMEVALLKEAAASPKGKRVQEIERVTEFLKRQNPRVFFKEFKDDPKKKDPNLLKRVFLDEPTTLNPEMYYTAIKPKLPAPEQAVVFKLRGINLLRR